jgi:hypothetical protein
MQQEYQTPTDFDQVVWRPVPMGTIARPPSYAMATPANPIKIAVIGAVSFMISGAIGGVFLGMRIAAVQIENANGRADKAEQRQQAVESQLASVQSQLKEFCSAVLSSPVQPTATPPTAGAVATNPPNP